MLDGTIEQTIARMNEHQNKQRIKRQKHQNARTSDIAVK